MGPVVIWERELKKPALLPSDWSLRTAARLYKLLEK
jgi:hypothetical protein